MEVEGLEQSSWAPAAPKVGQEGVDTQSKPSMAPLDFGVSRARMVTSSSVSEFSECSKNEVEQTFVSCIAPEVLTVLPALALVPVTLLIFALAQEATTSSFSHSFISIFFSNLQSPMFSL